MTNMRIRRFSGKKNISGVFYVFFIILLLRTPHSFARPFIGYPNSSLDLTLPLTRCRMYRDYEDNPDDENFASDNIENLLVSSSKDKLYLWDIAARRYLWNTELGMDVVSNIVINKNSLYLVGKTEKAGKSAIGRKEQNYFFKDINKLTGLTNRQTDLDLPASANEIFFLDFKKEKIIAVGQNGDVYFFNEADGGFGGKLRSGKKLSSVPFFSDDELIAGTSDGKIIIVSFEGSVSTAASAAKTVSAVIYTSDGKIIYGDKQGSVVALNKSDKSKIWKFRAGAEISDITETPFGTLISSFDNYVYLVSTATGKRIWKKRMPGRTFVKPLVKDGFAVIAGLSEPEAEVIELKTGRIVNRLFLETENSFDGAVFLFDDSLVFSTLKGLTAFTSLSGKCAEK